MDTTLRLHEVELVDERHHAVVAFFDALRTEQDRYLKAIRDAASELRNEPGQFGCVAASQGRLTHQFFDAQRLILMHRAEIDAEVSRIGLSAEDEADDLVRAAQATAAAARFVREEPAAQSAPAPAAADRVDTLGSARRRVAALGAVVVQTMADADSLASVIDAAFQPDEPDGVLARRQLSAVLDDWWHAENQEGRAAIDDAHARAAMRLHIARVQVGEILPEPVCATPERDVRDGADQTAAPRAPLPADPSSGQLPLRLIAALDDADPSDLHALLSSLSDALAPHSPSAEESLKDSFGPRTTGELVIRFDPDDPHGTPDNGPEEAFRRFWSKCPASAERSESRGWIPMRIVLPMAGAMSAIALTLAWIG